MALLPSSVSSYPTTSATLVDVYKRQGLTLFLTGVNVGFMPAGSYLGKQLASLPYRWIIVPVAMLIGYFIVKAEPAVQVLNKQVADMTGGTIRCV